MKKLIVVAIAVFTSFFVHAQNCPSISLVAPAEVTAGDTLTFTAEIKDAGNVSPTYNWAISAGTILSGQGTSVIMVTTEGLGGSFITATVESGGFPATCSVVTSSTVAILVAPTKIIAANYTTPQALTAAVQKFVTQTKLNDLSISQVAYVYIYSGTTTTAAQLKAIKTTMLAAFTKNNILSYQYTIADGGKKKAAAYEMYLIPEGSKEPKPSK